MGESRQELLNWINDLLQLNYSKIEQMGTGDVQMSRVKFNTVQEYEYVNNFKILQKCFTDHGLDKVVPVDRLVKCKFQDNLEFTQWVKKFWDTYFPGGQYDAVGRRKGGGSKPSSASMEIRKGGGSNMSVNPSPKPGTARRVAAAPSNRSITNNNNNNSGMNMPASNGGSPPSRGRAVPTNQKPASLSASGASSNAIVNELNKQITQLQVTVDGLEKERDFYFAKLRDVEIMVQSCMDEEPDSESPLAQFSKKVQDVLYSVAEGFEVPTEVNQENQQPIEQETY